MYAYSDLRRGFTRRITWGINRGYRLERHPQRSAESQDRPAAKGSAGIPDSLGHKRTLTSAGWDDQIPTPLLLPGIDYVPSLSLVGISQLSERFGKPDRTGHATDKPHARAVGNHATTPHGKSLEMGARDC